MNDEQSYTLTQAGYADLQRQLADYRERLAQHRAELTDIQHDSDEQFEEEGAEFEVRTRREFLEERIGNLELILSQATVLDEDPDPRTVDPGDRVTLWETTHREAVRYDLIGSAEAQYGRSGVSTESPVGAALLGRQVGDVVEVQTPDGRVRYVIQAIDRTPAVDGDGGRDT